MVLCSELISLIVVNPIDSGALYIFFFTFFLPFDTRASDEIRPRLKSVKSLKTRARDVVIGRAGKC